MAIVDDVQHATAVPPPVLTTRITLAMAVAAGCAAANVWYNQPMLGVIAADLGVSSRTVALIPTATQVGFASGIVLLLPLGDRMDRRALILRQLVGLTIALLAAALAPGAAALIVASAAVGMGACIAQQIVPFAAELAPPAARGRVVGTVMSGLLFGILLGRVLSGAVARHAGWRAMFFIAAGIAVLMGVMLALLLPRSRPQARASYAGLLVSLVALIRAEPALRRATLIQAGLFGGFTAFWSVLALQLQAPPLRLGSDVAGLFGLIGAAGVLVTSLAGRIVDRRGPRGVIGAGISSAGAAFVVFAVWPTLPGLIVGLILLDVGMQGSQIANQSIIYALRPDARGRINTVFMTGMFIGGAIGSGAAGLGWTLAGWPAVCAVGFCLALLSLAAHVGKPRIAAGSSRAK
jgi:predicted MFS family arabinose efflux permease